MAHNANADDGRTDTKRFDADDAPFDATDLIEGDRIDPSLVASTGGGLGGRRSAKPDAPETQLAEATITDHMDDVHTAILVDGDSGTLVRAGRHDSQNAMNQKEADWKVHGIGTSVEVTDAEWRDLDEDANPDRAATHWAQTVLCDMALGRFDYADEITVEGTSISMYEPYDSGRVTGTVELVEAK